jgi:hypothetical protein
MNEILNLKQIQMTKIQDNIKEQIAKIKTTNQSSKRDWEGIRGER